MHMNETAAHKQYAALTVWAWVLAVGSLLLVPLAIPAFVLGVLLAKRGQVGHGVGVMVLSVVSVAVVAIFLLSLFHQYLVTA